MLIRVNVDHKESIAIIEKRETNNVSVVKDVLFEREPYVSKSNIDVSWHSWVIIVFGWLSREC